MKRDLVQIYALAVCFFCAAGMAITVSFVLYGIVQATVPTFTLPGHQYERHADATAYRQSQIARAPESMQLEYAELSPEKLENERKRSLERHIATESRSGYQTILRCGIIFAVFACVFFLHWRLSRRQREAADSRRK